MTTHKTVVFNESEQVIPILENGFPNGKVTKYGLTLVAKHYVKIGIKESKLKETLIEFCKTHSIDFNEIAYRNLLNDAIKIALKYKMKGGEGQVIITKVEMDFIKNMDSKYSKSAFIMIALAKYNKYYPSNKKDNYLTNDQYYCNYSTKQILRMSKMPNSDEDIMDARNYFGNIKFGYPIWKKDTWLIFIIDELSEPEVIIENIGKILDYFPFYCEKCGKIVKKTGKRQKYCPECWKEMDRDRKH
jgi:hypothetical protein